MKTERKIRFSEAIVKSGFEQGARAGAQFFGRLRHKHDRAVPLIFQLRERARRTDERRNMRIVPAGVHHVDIFAFVILGRDFARVGQTCFLFHRQRIHVGAHKHRRPIAILHNADHSIALKFRIVVFAKVLGDLAASGTQLLCD